MATPWRTCSGGLELRLRVTPKGGRDAIEGVTVLPDGTCALKVRVRAAPEDGAANEAVRTLLCKALKVPASTVKLQTGATSRVKTFWIAGKAETIAAALAAMLTKPLA